MSYLKHIEEWLKNNSYTLDDFSNLNKLEELKKKS